MASLATFEKEAMQVRDTQSQGSGRFLALKTEGALGHVFMEAAISASVPEQVRYHFSNRLEQMLIERGESF